MTNNTGTHNLLDASVAYINATPIDKRKKLGQYMTPQPVAAAAAQLLNLKNGDKVLDPAAGTGELLCAAQNVNPKVVLHGWDIDPAILHAAHLNVPSAQFSNVNALEQIQYNNFFDAAIVNPPYFQTKLTSQQKKYFGEVVSGRANIFSLFFQKVIEMIKPNGMAAFIVPPSMNSGAYFENLRQYILRQTVIQSVQVFHDSSMFVDAQTAVQIIVLKKRATPLSSLSTTSANNPYVVDLQEITGAPITRYLFTEKKKAIEQMWGGKRSLHQLGYQVSTGTVVWNQHKNDFAAHPSPNSLVVYHSKDIAADNTIMLSNKLADKRYLPKNAAPPTSGENIIVNRIVGGVGSGGLRAALTPNTTYFVENHVNVIAKNLSTSQHVTPQKLHVMLTQNTDINDYLRIFTGNTQISAKELAYFTPVG